MMIFARSTFFSQVLHLLLQRAKEKHHPWLPVWCICPHSHLGLAKGQIIAVFALFDHAFQ
jgi:hypothetical protein